MAWCDAELNLARLRIPGGRLWRFRGRMRVDPSAFAQRAAATCAAIVLLQASLGGRHNNCDTAMGMSVARRLIAAWNRHRDRIISMIHEITEASPAQMHLFEAAAEAVLLYRLIQAASVNRAPAAVREPVQAHIDRANLLISDHLRNSNATDYLLPKIDVVRRTANARWASWHKDWKEALRLSTEAVANDPGNIEALFTRARMLIRLKRHKEALEPTLSVVSVAPHKERLVELMRTISDAAFAEEPVNRSTSNREVAELKARIDLLVKTAVATENVLARKAAELALTSAALAQKHEEITDLAHRIDQITSSTSWRITAPLRSAVQLLRNGRRRP